MKILDIPQSGKRGVTVSQGGRYGQISRALVIPTNPRTPAQMLIRNRLAAVAAKWRQLTQDQRDAWTAAAKAVNSTPRDGQSGTLTGGQLFSKINIANLTIGQQLVLDPPAKPGVSISPITGLVIAVAGGATTLKLTATDAPSDGTMVRVAAPVSAGRTKPGSYVYAGLAGDYANNAVDITALYTAKYGVPPAGTKVFVSVNQNISGWEDIPHEFWAIVPAGA